MATNWHKYVPDNNGTASAGSSLANCENIKVIKNSDIAERTSEGHDNQPLSYWHNDICDICGAKQS